jgi:VWFA-related protein
MRNVAFIAAAILSSILLPELNAQTAPAKPFTFSVQTQLVEVYMTVTKDNQLMPGMTSYDFQITEDGKPVAIDHFDSQDVPLQIAMLIDVSESVEPNLRYIQEAAIAFIKSLHPRDHVTLIFFNSEIHVFRQSGDDRKTLLKEIKGAEAAGATKLYDALHLGMEELEGKQGRKAIVCFTDGEDTSGTSSRTAVMNAAARYGFPIYTIGAGAGLEMASLKNILRDFAEVNSGKAFFIQNVGKLRKAFEEVSAELRSAYVLNYYTQIQPDGKWHELSVTSRDPGCVVRTRKGFFAVKK